MQMVELRSQGHSADLRKRHPTPSLIVAVTHQLESPTTRRHLLFANRQLARNIGNDGLLFFRAYGAKIKRASEVESNNSDESISINRANRLLNRKKQFRVERTVVHSVFAQRYR